MVRYIKVRMGLTGTQVGNSVIDTFGQYRAVEPSILGESYKEFKAKYCYQTGYMGFKVAINKTNKKEVLTLIAPITFELKKKDVFGITVLPPVYMYTELKGTQKKLYTQLEETTIAKVDKFQVSAPREITQMIRLQQITGGHVPSDEGEMMSFECAKADLLTDFLNNWDRKEKLVIFARYIYELDLIERICKKAKFSCYIYNHKEAYMDEEFQNKANPQISISQISKGISRTLTRANTIIFFSLTHSYIEYAQALGRCEARGVVKDPITPIFLITKDTIDEDYERAVRKKQTEAQFVSSFLRKLSLKRNC
jgi:superfamily II DNA or RNA helicase